MEFNFTDLTTHESIRNTETLSRILRAVPTP